MNLRSYIKLTKNGYRIAGNFRSWKFSRLLLNDTFCELNFEDRLAIDYIITFVYYRINFRDSCKIHESSEIIVLKNSPIRYYSSAAAHPVKTVLQEIRKSCKYFSCKTYKILQEILYRSCKSCTTNEVFLQDVKNLAKIFERKEFKIIFFQDLIKTLQIFHARVFISCKKSFIFSARLTRKILARLDFCNTDFTGQIAISGTRLIWYNHLLNSKHVRSYLNTAIPVL